jgi:hypothetical protein
MATSCRNKLPICLVSWGHFGKLFEADRLSCSRLVEACGAQFGWTTASPTYIQIDDYLPTARMLHKQRACAHAHGA